MLAAIALWAGATLIVQRLVPDDGTQAAAAKKKAEDQKKAGEGPKDPFNFGAFTVRPSETDHIESGIKPGHWTIGSLEVRANFDDFRGDLVAEMVGASGEGVDLDGLPFRLRSSRPALLPKAQKKVLDVALLCPTESFSRQVAPRLLSPSGRDVWNTREIMSLLPAEQFYFVVLARKPDDYRYLHSLDSIWAPQGSSEDRGVQAHYRVLLPSVTSMSPVPNNVLFWTSTAVVLWDEFDPGLLTPAQQQALVDWLHWGGQLIVSGPDSLESLRTSFLDGFLPAAAGESWEMTAETLAPLARLSADPQRTIRAGEPWTGAYLVLDGRDAHVLSATEKGEPLIAERRVGRGRTVVTAFRLSQRDLVNWPGHDAVFNAALLRRQPRRFAKSFEDKVGVEWADHVGSDPMRVSQLRIFTRDAGRVPAVRTADNQQGAAFVRAGLRLVPVAPAGDDPFGDADETAAQVRTGAGVAGWDDQSQASQAARDSLREAAGIQVPRRPFVFTLLGAYVLVLVPLNWLLFRGLGRVEIAWLAAPVIAIVFGVLIVRMAQLDIGFARSTTEIGLLEVQGDYPRGHLTRYCELYTSLSTDYSFELANPTAVALPFRTGSAILARQNRTTVVLRQQPETGAAGEVPVQLVNMDVASNSAGMVHSEEMFDLGGSIDVVSSGDGRTYRVRNGTTLRLQAVMVTARDGLAQLGTLERGGEATFTIARPSGSQTVFADWPGGSTAESPDKRGAPSLIALAELALKDTTEGAMLLLAWTDEVLPGVRIMPAANQARQATVIVAHLTYGPARPLELDFNSRAAVADTISGDDGDIDFHRPGADNGP
jgi:hypothetical protein